MVQELLKAMLPFPQESQICWCIRKSTYFLTIQDRQGGTLHQETWTIHSTVLSACFSCTCEPTQYNEGFCQWWPCTHSNSQHPSNLKLILNSCHNQVYFLIHLLSFKRKIGIREYNVQCRRQQDMKLPLNTLPRSLMELFLSCLIVSKSPFCVKLNHPSMLLSETPTSVVICLQTDRALLLNDRSSVMLGNLLLGKICSFTVVCSRNLKLPALETACPCWTIARLTAGAGTGAAGLETWGATTAGPATDAIGATGGRGAAWGAAQRQHYSGAAATTGTTML